MLPVFQHEQTAGSVFENFLNPNDATRAGRTFERLGQLGLGHFCLTGRLALELNRALRGEPAVRRALSDLDLVVTGLDAIPTGLAEGFLINHVHAKARAGKLVLQIIDADERLRIDLFTPYGDTLSRCITCPISPFPFVCVEDLAARAGQICMGLARQQTVTRKHVLDFALLAEWINPITVERAWRDHRQGSDPASFAEARELIPFLAQLYPELLVAPVYSQDATSICPKCVAAAPWRMAPKPQILSLLGYC